MILNRSDLMTLIANASWFADTYVRWTCLGKGRYRVKTNYPWVA